jgi:hypothetical protein
MYLMRPIRGNLDTDSYNKDKFKYWQDDTMLEYINS